MKKGHLVYGVGINDADYPVYKTEKVNGKRKIVWQCPAYKTWNNMFRRAYDQLYKAKYPTYVGVTVCKDWHLFSNFKIWWDAQPITNGLNLDKDLKIYGNKEYSPQSCVFVPDQVNALFTDRGNARGDLPLGVTYRKLTGKYMAQIQLGLGRGHKNLGSYTTIESAHKAWQVAKMQVIKDVLNWYEKQGCYDFSVANALQERISILESDLAVSKETVKL